MNQKSKIIVSYDKDSFLKEFESNGYVVLEDIFSAKFTADVIPELHKAIKIETEKYYTEEHTDYGMLRACPIYGGMFLEVLENDNYIQPFNWILGETCIIWVYTSSCLPPNKTNFASRIHVDRAHFIPNYNEGMGSLILLDDFTEENGGTWFLPGSHLKEDEPDADYFYKNAKRLIAPKGSVFYFNLRLWHASGLNHTKHWRNGLGIGMIRPHFKQRIDLPKAMGSVDISKLSKSAIQKLGFFAQTPTSLDEYYLNGTKKERNELQPSEWKTSIK